MACSILCLMGCQSSAVTTGVRRSVVGERSCGRALRKDLGVPAKTLRRWPRQLEADKGLRPDLPTGEEREQIKPCAKRSASCGAANEIPKAARMFSRSNTK
jgi:hypothetical protein